ncbi:MaoC family dehydratase [Dietzia maris]|uniref:MaoC family dehydratase n=1 Tax=Dietzia maris TaxID=37915 RepID=UPI0037C7E3E4
MKKFNNIAAFAAAVGADLGVSDWVVIDQARINQFADATGDRQWIHVDQERAEGGPFGRTIAHGFLTLSMIPVFHQQIYAVENVSMAVNYGLDKVRFISPVPEGARIRGSAVLDSAEVLDGAVQGVVRTTIEVEGNEKPAAIVTSIVRYFG